MVSAHLATDFTQAGHLTDDQNHKKAVAMASTPTRFGQRGYVCLLELRSLPAMRTKARPTVRPNTATFHR